MTLRDGQRQLGMVFITTLWGWFDRSPTERS
jgi:hypothetical protein